MLPKTQLLYQGDTYLFNLTAKILSLGPMRDDNKLTVILDQTIFYPQGGGQPTDVGTISDTEDPSSLMKVTAVRAIPEGVVEHEGVMTSGNFQVGQQVNLAVDRDVRILNSRIHSAGHLLDHAAERLKIPLVVQKGYHFPAGPYVEYGLRGPLQGEMTVDTSPQGLQELRRQWEAEAKRMIEEGLAITVTMEDLSNLAPVTLAELSPKVLATGKARLAYFQGAPLPRPCGGTHVANTRDLGVFSIKKISFKSSVLRVCYTVA